MFSDSGKVLYEFYERYGFSWNTVFTMVIILGIKKNMKMLSCYENVPISTEKIKKKQKK